MKVYFMYEKEWISHYHMEAYPQIHTQTHTQHGIRCHIRTHRHLFYFFLSCMKFMILDKEDTGNGLMDLSQLPE